MDPNLLHSVITGVVVGLLLLLAQRIVASRDKRFEKIEKDIEELQKEVNKHEVDNKGISTNLENVIDLVKDIKDKL